MIIGADCVNEFMKEKVVGGEVAWLTEVGWVLSGPRRSETTRVNDSGEQHSNR